MLLVYAIFDCFYRMQLILAFDPKRLGDFGLHAVQCDETRFLVERRIEYAGFDSPRPYSQRPLATPIAARWRAIGVRIGKNIASLVGPLG